MIVTAPGEEAQVDYGDGAMVRHPQTGKYRRTRLFVLTLGYSRKSRPAAHLEVERARSGRELHEQAFRRLGGVPATVVLDNLKEGVLTPDVYDPTLNPLYRDVLAHYGVGRAPVPRPPSRSQGQGRVERRPHAADAAARDALRESRRAARQYLDHWETRWADTRIHGTTKRQVAAMFAEEQPALRPLPLTPFRYYQYGTRTVHLDGCVEVDGAYYSAPPGHLGERLPVQWDGARVRLLDPHTRPAPPRASLAGARALSRSAPRIGRARTPPEVVAAPRAAPPAPAAPSAPSARTIHQQDGPLGVRRILGVLALAKHHGVPAVETACATALECGVPTYRFVRRYLERRAGGAPTLRQIDPLIRQLTLYRDLIDRVAAEGDPE